MESAHRRGVSVSEGEGVRGYWEKKKKRFFIGDLRNEGLGAQREKKKNECASCRSRYGKGGRGKRKGPIIRNNLPPRGCCSTRQRKRSGKGSKEGELASRRKGSAVCALGEAGEKGLLFEGEDLIRALRGKERKNEWEAGRGKLCSEESSGLGLYCKKKKGSRAPAHRKKCSSRTEEEKRLGYPLGEKREPISSDAADKSDVQAKPSAKEEKKTGQGGRREGSSLYAFGKPFLRRLTRKKKKTTAFFPFFPKKKRRNCKKKKRRSARARYARRQGLRGKKISRALQKGDLRKERGDTAIVPGRSRALRAVPQKKFLSRARGEKRRELKN